MVLDALRGYLQLANGITEEPRQRAAAAARSLLTQGESVEAGMPGHLQQQVSALAEELVITSRANRELLLGLIRTEVERTLGRLGIASADEVHALRRSVERLERLVRDQQAAVGEGDEGGESAPTSSSRRAGRTAAAAPKKEKKAPPATTAATTSAASRARTSAGTRSRATTVGQMSSTGSRRASRPAGEASTVGGNGDPATTTRSAGRRRRVPTDADANSDAEE